MSGLISSLVDNSQALGVHQRQVETSSRNLANVNNPAYARQRVEVKSGGEVAAGTQVLGLAVTAGVREQLRDQWLDRAVVREASSLSGLEAREDFLGRLEDNLTQALGRTVEAGGEGVPTGLQGSLENYFNSFQTLSTAPNDPSQRQLVMARAETLVESFHAADQRLTELDVEIGERASADTVKANGLLTQIRDLGAQIVRIELTSPGAAGDLRDQRQKSLEDLSKLMAVETREIPGKPGLLQISARDPLGNEVMLLDGVAQPTSLSIVSGQLRAGVPGTALAPGTGSIPAALDVQSGALADARDRLDRLARQLVGSVNAAYNPGGTSTNFFDPSGVTAATLTLDPSLNQTSLRATGTTNAGANELALAVARLATQSFSTGGGDAINGSFSNHLVDLATSVGIDLSETTSQREAQEIVVQSLGARRDGVSGVSVDEEVADLMRFQKSFQASARVVNILDRLLETVVTGLGR